MIGAREAWSGAQFFFDLPAYLRHPMTDTQARKRLPIGLRNREQALLDKTRLEIFSYPDRSDAQLMRCAGWEYGDIEAAVRRDGLDATLKTLLAAGIYLTIDEFKGRKPVRRGSTEIDVQPAMLQAPRVSYHLPARSSGSRGKGTPVMIDLEFIRACAANSAVSLGCRGVDRWTKAVWESPGAGLRFRTVKYAGFGDLPEATFSQVDPISDEIPAYYRWNLLLLKWVSAAVGKPLPWPAYTLLAESRALAEWLQVRRRAGETPHMFTFPSSAVILSRWAVENGFDISGSWFTLSGEPITEAGVNTIRAAGCHVIPRYGTMEVGVIAYGCPHQEHPDDMHLVANMHGLIQAEDAGAMAGLPPKALSMTSLHSQAPFVMLNLSMGDQAAMNDSSCGCPLEAVGWTRRIWSVRSFEKLTGTGVTFDGIEVIAVLAGVLPAQFGGLTNDYQLVEAEGQHGEPELILMVHPRLGELDDDAVAEGFLHALGSRTSSDGMMVQRLRDAGALRVERRPPTATVAGKIQYLHI